MLAWKIQMSSTSLSRVISIGVNLTMNISLKLRVARVLFAPWGSANKQKHTSANSNFKQYRLLKLTHMGLSLKSKLCKVDFYLVC